MNYTKLIILNLALCLISLAGNTQNYLITDFGATTDTAIINTGYINKAIETCSKNGGGKVIVPAGKFRTGTIIMKENVELHLEIGSTLFASSNPNDFPQQLEPTYRSIQDQAGWYALIYANDISNIAITGFGLIDGNGGNQEPRPALKGDYERRDGRPRNILFISCKNIRVEGVRMTNSGMWNQHYLNCEDVIVDRIEVFNHSNHNNDGIDIDGCRRFVLSNSIFDSDDDGITLKSTGPAATEDVVITNCVVSSFCNAIKAGTESTGGFRNISISNCIIKPSYSLSTPIYDTPRHGITGISLEIVDGGVMEGITITNVTIEGTDCPLYIRLGNRARKHTPGAAEPRMGAIRNIAINNLIAYNTGNYCSSITSIPGHYVENISLSNIHLCNEGGLKLGDYKEGLEAVSEDEKGYPQPTIWGNLPSSALFIRHAKNIQVNGLLLNSKNDDSRVPIIASDVDGIQVKNVGKIDRVTAKTFFKGIGCKNFDVDKPLGWKEKITLIEK